MSESEMDKKNNSKKIRSNFIRVKENLFLYLVSVQSNLKIKDIKKIIILNIPYVFIFYIGNKMAWLYRYCRGTSTFARILVLLVNFSKAFDNPFLSIKIADIFAGLMIACAFKLFIYVRSKNAKKYRKGVEYGSARWGTAEDIKPFIDPIFENNIILTKTERLTMNSRPKQAKYARNKNVLVIGGSGSGKTRFFVKPNLMQMSDRTSYVVTDPKGTILVECGKMLSRGTPAKDKNGKIIVRNGKVVYHRFKIKVFNINDFSQSMHYNPFSYIRSEKDILKLANVIIENTKGDGEKSGEDFWIKAERLLYCALIGYIYYEAPPEEQNMATLLEFLDASETREEDESFKNAVDMLFEELEEENPTHFAVRQYKKYKLAAGDVCSK